MPETEANKEIVIQTIARIRRKLLDLTRRNNLLNFRETKSTIRVVDELPDEAFNMLVVEGKTLELLELPEPEEAEEDSQIALFQDSNNADNSIEEINIDHELPEDTGEAQERHTDKYLQTSLIAKILERRCKNVLRNSRTSIEETGINLLYLTIGFLEWYEADNSEVTNKAPLILVPIRIERTRLNAQTNCYSYVISYNGEDIETNLSLAKRLDHDNNLILPEINDEITPENYFDKVAETIKEKRHWRVAREMVIGFFSFSKLRIYKDLSDESWPKDLVLSDHSSVRQIIAGFTEERERSDPAIYGEEFNIDKHPGAEKIYLVQEADSSQYSALIDVVLNNNNLVIEGPPGTGKSQTITNLIAAALYSGKNVLFIAEKKAALEVVRKRLDIAGLGDFCLELHSHKTQKGQLLADIGKRINQKYEDAQRIDSKIVILTEQREELIKYYDLLNKKPGATDETIFEILWAAERWRTELDETPISFHVENCLELTATQIEVSVNAVDDFAQAYMAIPKHVIAIWDGFEPKALIPGDDTDIKNKLIALKEKLDELIEYFTSIKGDHNFPTSDSLDGLRNFIKFEEKALPPKPGFYDYGLAKKLLTKSGAQALVDLEEYIREYNELSEEANEVLGDFANWKLEDLQKIEKAISSLDQFSWGDFTPVQLTQLLEKFISIIDNLEKFKQSPESIQHLLYQPPKKIKDYTQILKIDKILKEAPSEVELNSVPKHALSVANVVMQQAKAENDKLGAIQDDLAKTFNLKNTPDPLVIREISLTFHKCNNFFKRFFSSEFGNAKKKLLVFLNNPKDFKRADITEALITLAEFKENAKTFEQDSKFNDVLGSYFRGIESNWELLESVILWAQKLAETMLSQNMASSLLSDFLCNRERFNLAAKNIGTLWALIKEDLVRLKIEYDANSEVSKLSGDANNRLTILRESLKYLNSHKKLNKFDLETIYNAVEATIIIYRLLKSLDEDSRFPQIFGEHYAGIETEIKKIRELCDWIDNAREQLSFDKNLIDWIISADVDDRLKMLHTFAGYCTHFFAGLEEFIKQISKHGSLNYNLWVTESEDSVLSLNAIPLKFQSAIDNAQHLIAWSDYCLSRKRGKKLGFLPIIECIEKGILEPKVAVPYTRYIVYLSMAKEIVREHEILTHFQRTTYDNIRERLSELDKTIQVLSRKRIAYKISKRTIPWGVGAGRIRDYTEFSLIQRELTKKKRHIPIRQLVRRAGNALQAIKPCFMMSPLSVSQYLIPGHISFDLIVMDEASQLRLEEVISAVARGEQLVVVGDPKQLPPTTFFDRLNEVTEEEEDEMTAAEEAESILDICQNNFHTRRLRWHYRSEHESLIAFSNSEFYDNDLIIFPAPYTVNKNFGVRHHFIEGASYKKGRNRIEAQVVALAVAEHFKRFPELSLGVATFNVEQRDLIIDEIERLQKKHSWLEQKISSTENKEEPFFVKNLENVQGDERDIIFISATYGPDADTGQVYQRFGPINRPTGWRRLNVIVTRAKKRLHLYTSMNSPDVRITPGASKGVVALHNYLKFAETGNIPEIGVATGRSADSDFEIAVAKLLNQRGYQTTLQVGVTGFFIDIAVHHPDRPEEYMLGIECDGATYHSAKSIRDRDLLRQRILVSKGWDIYRIWSTDWFKNRDREIEKLLNILQELVDSSRARVTEPVVIEEPEEEAYVDGIYDEEEFEFEVATEIIVKEEVDAEEALREALLEFRRKRIEPTTESLDKCILADNLLEEFIRRMPTSRNDFLQFPLEMRENIAFGQVPEYLDDILEITEEYDY